MRNLTTPPADLKQHVESLLDKNTAKRDKTLADQKSNKRIENLFADIKRIQKQPPVAEKPIPQASNSALEARTQLETLNAHILKLEAQLKESELHAASLNVPTPPKTEVLEPRAASPIIYEQEQVGFSFQNDTLLPLQSGTLAEPKTENIINAPLTASGRTIGEIKIEPPADRAWSSEETSLANAVAQQMSVQIQNLRLLAATERARAEAQEANRQFTHQNWESYMDGIHQSERVGFVYDQASVAPFSETKPDHHDFQETVNVLDTQIGNLYLKTDPTRPLTAEDKSMVSAVARQISQQVENLRLLADASRARADAEAANRLLTRENWKSYGNQRGEALAFAYDSVKVTPVNQSDLPLDINFEQALKVRGESIGQLTVAGLKDIPVGALELANSIAEQVSAHIENLRLFELNERRARELETVAVVSTTASTVLNPDELLQAVVDLTKERFNLYHAHIYLSNESWNTLLLAAGAGEIGRAMVLTGHSIEIDAEKSLVARATREGTVLIVNDVRLDRDYLPNASLPDTRSEMAVPMISGDKVIGVFDVQSNKPGYFTQEDANIYTTLALQVAVALQNARLYVEQAATVTQLRELDRLKSSFLANMSHELRTPLNSILGFADVMLEELDGPLTENMNNDLGLIYKNGQHLLHLINDVLDMAKIESGKMNLSIEKFNLQEVIEEVTSITSTLASEKNLALFIEPNSDHEIEIYADKIRLRQVMINLINNSIKFTEQGKISICVARQEETILITVKDTGIGIPAEMLESVFQEFTQVDTSTTRKAGGTGLGLPISRRLINMHNGRLWAESSGVNGEGSSFFVLLPIHAKVSEEPS